MQIPSWPAKRETPFPSSSLLDVSHYLQVRTVTRNSADTTPLLISDHSHSSLLQPAAFDGSPVDDVCLSFERVDVTYLLSEVKAQLGTYTIAKKPGYCKPAEASQDEATRQHEQFDDNLFWQSIKPIYGSQLLDLLS